MSIKMFRVWQHLLPTGEVWRVVADKALRRIILALATWSDGPRSFADDVFDDVSPETTRVLDEWEEQLGLPPVASDAVRRQQLDAAWKSQGGQSPRYIQDVLQAAGFNVFIAEWWTWSGPTRVARDPLAYAQQPRIGTVQCGESRALCGVRSAYCNDLLANEPGYLVNKRLSRRAPPAIPTATSYRPFFIYFGGDANMSTRASIPATRRAEFERLVLKLCPPHCWIVTYVTWT